MKKLLIALACWASVFAMPITAYAAKDSTDTYEYELQDGKAVLTKYATTSNATKIKIPQKVDGYDVIGLEGTFEQNQRIESVVIPDGVEFLGDRTFSCCRKMKTINLPDSLNEIKANCFEYSGIEKIVLPSSVNNIDRQAFYECDKLVTLEMSNSSITEIPYEVFYGCDSLKYISFPNELTTIGEWSFFNCSSIENLSFPDSVKVIDNGAFISCSKLNDVELPISLTLLGIGAFNDCDSIQNFVIPSNVTEIKIGGLLLISGDNLKQITNNSNHDFDKNVFKSITDKENEWYLSENGNDIAEFIPAHATIYRRKNNNQDGTESDNEYISANAYVKNILSTIPQKVSMEKVNTKEEALKYAKSYFSDNLIEKYDIDISITEFTPGIAGTVEQLWGTNGKFRISVWAENEQRHLYRPITIEAPYHVVKDDEIDSVTLSDDPLEDDYAKRYLKALVKLKENGVSMEKVNTIKEMEQYIMSQAPDGRDGKLSVVIEMTGGFTAAIPGTINNPIGVHGAAHPWITIKNTSNSIGNGVIVGRTIPIWATPYKTATSNTPSRGSGSSRGSSSSSSRITTNNSSTKTQGIQISKPNIMNGVWEQVNGKWKLKVSDNSYAASQWAYLGNKWYFLGNDGYMLTGWQMVNGKWYYMDTTGAMMADTVTPDGYRVNQNGEWVN